MNISIIHLILLIAAVWRLSNLLANEDGPFHFFKTLRSKIGRMEVRSRRKNGIISKLHLYEGVHCEYCNSVWFGIGLSFAYGLTNSGSLAGIGWFVLPFALSTGAILIKHIVFFIKSVDTRFDQQNQSYLAAKVALDKRMSGSYSAPDVRQVVNERGDEIIFSYQTERR